MPESIEWLRLLIVHHRSIEYIIIFLGTAIGGEIALFALGFIAAQGVLSISPLLIFSFLGSFLPNILWFILGRTKTINKIITHRYANSTVSMINEAVIRTSRENHVLALIFIKFLVGTPPILVMYINKVGLRFWQFMYYETPAIILSVLVLTGIGFLSGLGFEFLTDIFNNLYVAIGFILLILLVMTAFQLWFKKMFENVKE